MTQEGRIAAIILNWNRLDETAICCESLHNQDYPALDVWVVDNGSTAHTLGDLERVCPHAKVLGLDSNRGFAGGVNAGIRAAVAAGNIDFIWLVNNDVVCSPETLDRMLAVFSSDAHMAAVGCDMIEGCDNAAVAHVRAGKTLRPPLYIPIEASKGKDVDYLCGACLLIRYPALKAVGLLDEGFFFFFEDADWCFRARKLGWHIGFVEETLVKHKGSSTIGSLSRLRALYYRAGYVRFLRRHTRYPLLLSVLPTLFRLSADALRGNGAAVLGTLHGWRKGWK
jgi:GT2 family glycosyltransferase